MSLNDTVNCQKVSGNFKGIYIFIRNTQSIFYSVCLWNNGLLKTSLGRLLFSCWFSIFKGTTLSNSFLITVCTKGNWYGMRYTIESSMDFSIFSPISFHLNLLKLKHVCLHPWIFATNNNSWKPLNIFKARAPLMSFVVCHVMNASMPPMLLKRHGKLTEACWNHRHGTDWTSDKFHTVVYKMVLKVLFW